MALSAATVIDLYRSLEEVTPLARDCGELCGQACCRGGEDLGIYLFPGEEAVFTGEEDWLEWRYPKAKHHGLPPEWKGRVPVVRCIRPCPRAWRPLQCRFFPLAPHRLRSGELLLILDPVDVPYRCPLIAEEIGLRDDFVQKVGEAWVEMLKDGDIQRLVQWESACREAELDYLPRIVAAFSR